MKKEMLHAAGFVSRLMLACGNALFFRHIHRTRGHEITRPSVTDTSARRREPRFSIHTRPCSWECAVASPAQKHRHRCRAPRFDLTSNQLNLRRLSYDALSHGGHLTQILRIHEYSSCTLRSLPAISCSSCRI